MNEIFDTVEQNIQRKIVSDVMEEVGQHLEIDTRVEKEDCDDPGRHWRKVGSDWRCLQLFEAGKPVWSQADEDIYKKMKKYGLDNFGKYYSAILDCAEHGGKDKVVDTPAIWPWGRDSNVLLQPAGRRNYNTQLR